MNWNTILILIIVGGIALIWLFSREDWTLMVCSAKLNAAECYSNSYVISEFKTQKECMLEGVSRFSQQGFECGKTAKSKPDCKCARKFVIQLAVQSDDHNNGLGTAMEDQQISRASSAGMNVVTVRASESS